MLVFYREVHYHCGSASMLFLMLSCACNAMKYGYLVWYSSVTYKYTFFDDEVTTQNTFCGTGALWGNLLGTDGQCGMISLFYTERAVEQTIELFVIRNVMTLMWRHCHNHRRHHHHCRRHMSNFEFILSHSLSERMKSSFMMYANELIEAEWCIYASAN